MIGSGRCEYVTYCLAYHKAIILLGRQEFHLGGGGGGGRWIDCAKANYRGGVWGYRGIPP